MKITIPFVKVFKHTDKYGPVTSRDLEMIQEFIKFGSNRNLEILKQTGNYTEEEIELVIMLRMFSPNNEDSQIVIDNFTDWLEELEES